MDDADGIVLDALLDDVLDESIVTEAIDAALGLIQTPASDRFLTREKQLATVEAELATVNQERARLVTAIAVGGHLDGLLSALQERETRRVTLEAPREALCSERRLRASDLARAREELIALAASWRRVLADDPAHARPIVASLLKGRVRFAPLESHRWRVSGEGSLIGLFSREVAGRGIVPNRIGNTGTGRRTVVGGGVEAAAGRTMVNLAAVRPQALSPCDASGREALWPPGRG
jgi:hypothetical protein